MQSAEAESKCHLDLRVLHRLKDSTGERFAAGLVLYDGEVTASFGDRLYAVPIRALWETS